MSKSRFLPVCRLRISFINHLVIVAIAWIMLLMVVFYTAEAVYFSPAPQPPAYDIAAAGDRVTSVPVSDQHAKRSLDERLREADPQRGEIFFGQCVQCHTAFENGPNRVGPNLWGIVNHPAGAVPDFRYSQAMRLFAEKGRKWDFATLDVFLTSPAGLIKGTAMAFAGVKDDKARADLLLYLGTLAAKPAALPPKNF